MESLIQTYLPNVYKMGWAGQAGWGTAIYLTLYMTVLSFKGIVAHKWECNTTVRKL